MGKRYNRDGSISKLYGQADLTSGAISKMQGTVERGVAASDKAGKLPLLAEIAQTSVERLERIQKKPTDNAMVLQKIAAALEILNDPAELQQWQNRNSNGGGPFVLEFVNEGSMA